MLCAGAGKSDLQRHGEVTWGVYVYMIPWSRLSACPGSALAGGDSNGHSVLRWVFGATLGSVHLTSYTVG
eukprot:scaffold185388_cov35-Prasinocladus_malaysianus.AAC.1